jgi:hypothetical protein
MIATSRVRYFTQRPNGSIDDTGFELVQYPGHGEMWEPADTTFARGANGPTKVLTGVRVVQESGNGLAPFNSNVFYPRTGTAAA